MTSIPMGGFGGQPQQPRQPQQPQGGFGGGFQPTRQRFNPMPQQQQGFGRFGGGFGGFNGGGFGMPQQQQGFGGFGGYGMPQQQGFGGFGGDSNPGVNGFPGPQQMQPMVQPIPPQQQLGQIAPQQQNSSARQSFEQFIASGGPRGAGAGLFNMIQGGQTPQQENPAGQSPMDQIQRYSQMMQQTQQPMVQPPAPPQQVRPMVQPTPPQQQAERAIPQIAGAPLNPAERYQKMMRQQQQQRMGEISGNPYSQQLGQEDRRMEAMRKMQQMNLGG